MALGALTGCAGRPAVRTIALEDLEAAPAQPILRRQRLQVHDTAALQALSTPLSRRLALVQIRSRPDWERLRRAAPAVGTCPDLRRGTAVGLVCWAGTSVQGSWPISLDGLQVCSGGGLLRAHFEPGSYLPDGTACLELTYCVGLSSVLLVDVSGTTFVPEYALAE